MIWGSQTKPGEPEYFQFDLLRKYIVTFGQLFSDIVIQRDAANNTTQIIKVPFVYEAKEKAIQRLTSDPNLDRPYSTLVPQITFELASPAIAYDKQARGITPLSKNILRDVNNKNKFLVQYQAVPYNIFFNVYIYMKNQVDGARIIEQILGFFQPDWTPTIELIPSMNQVLDCPVEIMPMDYTDLYDEKFQNRRILFYTLHFRMRGWFFGPIREKPIIKFIQKNIYAGIPTGLALANGNSLPNLITLNYTNATGGFPVNSNVYTYFANGSINGSGIINSWDLANNTTGTIVVQTTGGNLYTNSFFYSTGNTYSAQLLSANGFIDGIYDSQGNFAPNPQLDEIVVSQPMLTANGLPTFSVNNSIDYHLIDIDDDYGFGSYIANTGLIR